MASLSDVVRIAGLVAGGICVLAGGYLVHLSSLTGEAWEEKIANGLGIFFVGIGAYVALRVWLLAEPIRERERASRATSG